MPNFIHHDYNQHSMIVVNFIDQLIPGTFEHAIHYLVENEVDITVYFDAYKNDKNGRPAYNPSILLKIILFAYSKGITSSRQIEWHCKTNIIFKALSCDTVPHNTTIAAFISSHPKAVASVFEQILLTCENQDLLGHELIAIDGCKMSSNAGKEWSGTLKELGHKRDKIKNQIDQHIKEDKESNNNTFEEARKKRSRQAVDTLTKAYNKIDKFLETAKPRIGEGKRKVEVKSNITDNESAKLGGFNGTDQGYNSVTSADQKHQVITDAQAFGHGAEQATLQPVLKTIGERYTRLAINEDIYKTGMIITADTGFADEPNMQYLHENNINAYVPDNQFRKRDDKYKEQIKNHGKRSDHRKNSKAKSVIPSSEFRYDPTTETCHCPEGHVMTLIKKGENQRGIETVKFHSRVSLCRQCHIVSRCMRNPDAIYKPKAHGRQVSFINEEKRKPTYTDWMKERIDSDKGKHIYSQRMAVIEPVFGNLSNKGLKRFSLRGKIKVENQLKLFCLVHNIEKLKNYGNIAA